MTIKLDKLGHELDRAEERLARALRKWLRARDRFRAHLRRKAKNDDSRSIEIAAEAIRAASMRKGEP